MTFKEYIRLAHDEGWFSDTPSGDFLVDALRDKKFREFTKWPDLETYLIFHAGGNTAVVQAAKYVFKRWRAYCENH